jgi:hypothetical protein
MHAEFLSHASLCLAADARIDQEELNSSPLLCMYEICDMLASRVHDTCEYHTQTRQMSKGAGLKEKGVLLVQLCVQGNQWTLYDKTIDGKGCESCLIDAPIFDYSRSTL